MKKLLLSLVVFSFFASAQAQLVVNAGVTPAQLVNGFIGSGLSVSNITLNCAAGAYGTFSNGNTTNLGLTNGSIFTSGAAGGAIGPDNTGSYSVSNGTFTSDPDLTTIEPSATNDPCILTFDVIPSCSVLTIRFVFGSEEYPEFVNAGFNDAFGFFITGPNPSGPAYAGYNVARLPNTTPVSIDNVNAGLNSGYYVNNAGGATIQYDGITAVITSNLSVVPCQTYTFKIAIADAGDYIYDSGVFIDLLTCSTAIVSTTSSTPSCGCSGTATVNASGGQPAYTYVWNTTPAQNTQTATGLCPGNYIVTVYDQNGCVSNSNSSNVTVGSISGGTASASTTNNVNCSGGNNGNASANITGGTAPFTYVWSNTQTGQNATGLTAGTYTCTVTDAVGCSSTATVTITEPLPVTASVTGVAAGCGMTNGTANATPAGGTPNYTYAWNNGQTTQSITGLSGGTYSVTITDVNGCTATGTVNVSSSSAPSVTASSTQAICGMANGSATASTTGGTAPYTYVWNNGQTTSSISGLTAGTYSVTVSDASCNASGVELVSNGDFSAGNTGFTSSYTYCNTANCLTLEGLYAVGTNATFYHPSFVGTDHTTGSGNFLIVNGAGTPGVNVWCQTITVTPNTNYLFSTWVSSLYASSPALLQFSINGVPLGPIFTAPATVNTWQQFFSTWNSGANTSITICIENQNTTLAGNDFGLDDISFQACVPCTGTAIVTITQPSAMTDVMSQQNIKCNGGSGNATVTPSGGTPTYTYAWSNGQTTATATGLTAGNYSVVITDANGCTAIDSATLSQPTILSTSVSATTILCNGGKSNATVSPVGGTPVYTYAWSNGQTTASATGLAAGNYNVTVTDANGCTSTASVSITQPQPLTASVTQTNVKCNGGNNGNATATMNGGSAPYTYLWSNSQTTQTATGLSQGNYNVLITDANGCTAQSSATITQPQPLAASVTQTNIKCNGGNNGSATATTNGGTAPYTYVWNNGQTTANTTGLIAGNYNVTVTDNNGCSTTQPVTITQPQPVTLSISCGDSVCFGKSTTLSATATGGTPSYTYVWLPGPKNGSAISVNPTASTTYSLSVTDANGCTSGNSQNCSVVVLPSPNANFDTLSQSNLSSMYAFLDSSTGGNSWSWNFGDPNSTSNTSSQQNPVHTFSGAGTYTVTQIVFNSFGCPDTSKIIVTIHEGILIPNVFTPDGDGYNDVWYIPNSGMKEFHVEIYNRWGEKVFETTADEIRWDGHSTSGKMLNDGTYYYALHAVLKSGSKGKDYSCTGYVTLLTKK